MPASKKSPNQPTHVLVWNRGRTDGNGTYRAGVVHINYQEARGREGRVAPVIHPVRPGLDLIERVAFERQLEDAKRVGPKHMWSKMTSGSKPRISVVDLETMPHDEACEAIDQTMSKGVLIRIAEGKIAAPAKVREHAVNVRATWGRQDISQVRKITSHFASFARAEEG